MVTQAESETSVQLSEGAVMLSPDQLTYAYGIGVKAQRHLISALDVLQWQPAYARQRSALALLDKASAQISELKALLSEGEAGLTFTSEKGAA